MNKSNKNQRDNNLEYNPRTEQLGIKIPEVSPPVANYVHSKIRKLIILSRSGQKKQMDQIYRKLGKELTIEDGYHSMAN